MSFILKVMQQGPVNRFIKMFSVLLFHQRCLKTRYNENTSPNSVSNKSRISSTPNVKFFVHVHPTIISWKVDWNLSSGLWDIMLTQAKAVSPYFPRQQKFSFNVHEGGWITASCWVQEEQRRSASRLPALRKWIKSIGLTVHEVWERAALAATLRRNPAVMMVLFTRSLSTSVWSEWSKLV